MREIKFRAWHKDLKIMREVFSINFDHNEVTVGYPDSETLRATLYDGEFELMQFSGLNDYQGTPIFEGDILLVGNFTFYVTYDFCSFMVKETKESSMLFSLSNINKFSIIIGNIRSNPELLETK